MKQKKETKLQRIIRKAESGEFRRGDITIRISRYGHSMTRFCKRKNFQKTMEEIMFAFAEVEYFKMFREKKTEKIPYFAIGNDELAKKKKAGKTAKCPKCGKQHVIKYGTSRIMLPSGKMSKSKKSKSLGFISCGKKSFLATIDGKEINGRGL
jgi:hypothetical protein